MIMYWKHVGKASLNADCGVKSLVILWSTELDVLSIHSLDLDPWPPSSAFLPTQDP